MQVHKVFETIAHHKAMSMSDIRQCAFENWQLEINLLSQLIFHERFVPEKVRELLEKIASHFLLMMLHGQL